MKRDLNLLICCLFIVLLQASMLMGQTGGGTIVGTVSDASGASVPGAEVEVTNVQTGTLLKTTTSSAGEYVFPVVPVGTYTLTVTAKGFAQTIIGQVIVLLDKTLTENAALRVGATSTKVDVSASVVQLDTHTSQAQTALDHDTYSALPIALNGGPRSVTYVADLMPGTAEAPGVTSFAGADNQAFASSINGGQTFGGEVMYDGALLAQSSIAGDYRVQPVPVEALQEFNLIQNSFSAEYGGTPGGVLSFNTRSGTNKLHGELFEFLQNDALDSRGFYAPSVPPLRQNEFGVNIGGPVYIPHVYNGKEKTFFFGYYSGYRLSAGVQPTLATIPTAAEQSGDFSNFRGPDGNVVPIYDPTTTQCDAQGVCTRQQFSYNGKLNVIPPNRITDIAKALGPYIPTPMNSNQINNMLQTGTDKTSVNRYGVKIDHYLSPKYIIHGFFGQTLSNHADQQVLYKFPFSGGLLQPNDYMLANFSQDITLAPNKLLHITLGWNRDNLSYYSIGATSHNTFGVQGVPPTTPAYFFNTDNYAEAGSNYGETEIENGSTITGFLSWIKGKHEIKIGAAGVAHQDNSLPLSASFFYFSNLETNLPSAPNPSATGNSFASFLVGAVDNGQVTTSPFEMGSRHRQMWVYFQDNYKATSKLSLNLGLRYDIPWTGTYAHNIYSSFDATLANPGAGGRLGALAFAGYGPGRTGKPNFADTRYIYLQPRFGFAYSLNDKTVLRGGFGTFIGGSGDVITDNGTRAQYALGYNAYPIFKSTNVGVTPAFYIQNGFPAYIPPPFIDPTYVNNGSIGYVQPQDGNTAYISDWSLDLQRALPGKFLLDVGYVGNSAHHNGSNLLNINQVDPKYLSLGNALNAPLSSPLGQTTGVPLPYAGFTGTVAQALRAYPQYQSISQLLQTDGKAQYNSLQVKLQRQFFRGLSVLTSYTYAKLMTNADSQQGWFSEFGAGGSQNAFDLRQEFSNSVIVPPQVLNVTYVYELPVGKGKRFVNNSRAADLIIGGWSVSGIQHYTSGHSLGVQMPNTLPLFSYNLYPNIVPGQSLRANWSGRFDPNKDVLLNANAFSTPAPFTFGNATRSLPVRCFSYYNEDISFQKKFQIKEASAFLIGVDLFNTFNRVAFGTPNTSSPNTNPNFGHVTSQINPPRSIQFRATLTF
jgi:hypothetical protein